MIRAVVALMIAGAMAFSAHAQSPPPSQLAPGSSGAAIAPQGLAPSPQPRSAIPDPAPGGNTAQAPIATTPPMPTTPSAPRK
jgi:hypothetical protein